MGDKSPKNIKKQQQNNASKKAGKKPAADKK
jgi:hypothetical protein